MQDVLKTKVLEKVSERLSRCQTIEMLIKKGIITFTQETNIYQRQRNLI